VAYVGAKTLRAEEKVARGGWAEDARRPARDGRFLMLGKVRSFERFVLPKIRDCQAERVNGDEFVRHVGLKQENKIGGVEVAF